LPGASFSTSETVACETPTFAAMSDIVGRFVILSFTQFLSQTVGMHVRKSDGQCEAAGLQELRF
jgi:hypothetical protein